MTKKHAAAAFHRLFALILIAVLFALCMTPNAHAQEASRLDEILKRGHLIVGTSSESPPFGFVDEKGDLVGFDIDIARLIAKAIFKDPSKVEFVKQGFSARWANTQSGKIDFGIQVTTIWPERVLPVAFTRAYIDAGTRLIVKKDSPYQKPSDLNSEGVVFANLTVPVQEERVKRDFPRASAITLDTTSAQFTAVKTGRAHAAQLDVAQALYFANTNDDIRVLDDWLTPPLNNAIFLKHGDPTLYRVLDTLVGELREGSLYEEYAEVYRKWFGVRPIHGKHWVEAQYRVAGK